jgi:hypothetical protein
MEFDELQKIWDSQNNQVLYAINEKAMHQHIEIKMKKGKHITNISELLLIIVNLVTGSFIIAVNLFKQQVNISLYLVAAWMLGTALYSLVSRIRRIKGNQRFDRSLQGDLDHAISLASYQVRLSQIMRWNMLPVAVLTVVSIWEGGKSLWIAGILVGFFALAWFAARWEHGIYKSRKRALEKLQTKLATN